MGEGGVWDRLRPINWLVRSELSGWGNGSFEDWLGSDRTVEMETSDRESTGNSIPGSSLSKAYGLQAGLDIHYSIGMDGRQEENGKNGADTSSKSNNSTRESRATQGLTTFKNDLDQWTVGLYIGSHKHSIKLKLTGRNETFLVRTTRSSVGGGGVMKLKFLSLYVLATSIG